MSGRMDPQVWTPAEVGAVVVPDTRRHACSACGGPRNVPGQAYCRSCHAERMRQQRKRDKARIQGRIHALQRRIMLAVLADGQWHTHEQLDADARAGDALPDRLLELEQAGRRIETHRAGDGALQYRLADERPATGGAA